MGSRCLQTQQFNHQNMAEGPGKKPNHQAAGKKKKIKYKLTYKMRYIFSLSIMWGKQKEDVLVRLDGTVN